MFKKFHQYFTGIMARIAAVVSKADEYVHIALTASTKLLTFLKGDLADITIAQLFPGLPEDLKAKAEEAVTQAIRYLTQSDVVLNAGTPELMLKEFLKQLALDAPGVQKGKAFQFASEVLLHLDGGKFGRSVYNYLVQKAFTALKLGVPQEVVE